MKNKKKASQNPKSEEKSAHGHRAERTVVGNDAKPTMAVTCCSEIKDHCCKKIPGSDNSKFPSDLIIECLPLSFTN